jgi:hypothetical protein
MRWHVSVFFCVIWHDAGHQQERQGSCNVVRNLSCRVFSHSKLDCFIESSPLAWTAWDYQTEQRNKTEIASQTNKSRDSQSIIWQTIVRLKERVVFIRANGCVFGSPRVARESEVSEGVTRGLAVSRCGHRGQLQASGLHQHEQWPIQSQESRQVVTRLVAWTPKFGLGYKW